MEQVILLGFIFSCKIFLAHATNSLHLGIFNPSWLREIAVAFQSPCARVSGWLVYRYCWITNSPSVIHAYWQVPRWIGHLLVSQTQTLSIFYRLFVSSVLHIDCSQSDKFHYSLSAKYEHMQNRSNLQKNIFLTHFNWHGIANIISFGHSIN